MIHILFTILCNHHLSLIKNTSPQKETYYPINTISHSTLSRLLATTDVSLSLWSCLFFTQTSPMCDPAQLVRSETTGCLLAAVAMDVDGSDQAPHCVCCVARPRHGLPSSCEQVLLTPPPLFCAPSAQIVPPEVLGDGVHSGPGPACSGGEERRVSCISVLPQNHLPFPDSRMPRSIRQSPHTAGVQAGIPGTAVTGTLTVTSADTCPCPISSSCSSAASLSDSLRVRDRGSKVASNLS